MLGFFMSVNKWINHIRHCNGTFFTISKQLINTFPCRLKIIISCCLNLLSLYIYMCNSIIQIQKISSHWTWDRFWDQWHQSAPVSLMTNTRVVIVVTFLSESSRTSFLNLSLTRSPLCSPIPVPSFPKSVSLSQPQGQHLFYIPSVISFLDRLKHKHYKGFTVAWPSRSWERKQFAEQLLNKSVITFIILIVLCIVFFPIINTIIIIIVKNTMGGLNMLEKQVQSECRQCHLLVC